MSESSIPLYPDPTFDEVYAIELSEKACAVCVKRIKLGGAIVCRLGKHYPACRAQVDGFETGEKTS